MRLRLQEETSIRMPRILAVQSPCEILSISEGGAFMRAFKLVPLFSIIFMLGGSPLLTSSYYAYAQWWCCDPCVCAGWCVCNGSNGCPRYGCDRYDSASLQGQAMGNNEKLYVSGSYVSSPAPSLKANRIDRLIAP